MIKFYLQQWRMARKHRGVEIKQPCKLSPYMIIGGGTVINPYCWFSGDIEIGCQCSIAVGVKMFEKNHDLTHELQAPRINKLRLLNQFVSKGPIIVGDDVWIGADAIILSGVNIGSHAVIGAGSVVTKNVPEWEIWAGNPAKKIGVRKVERR